MTWKIEVRAAGRYEAIVHYTCSKADVGSMVELSVGKWQGAIAKAHDRVPRRGESDVKDFRPLSLGVVKLAAGKGTLTLRAAKVAGNQVADVRAVELVLLAEEP